MSVPYALAGDDPALRGVVLLDAGIPGVSLPEAIPIASENAYRLAHFAFHLVPDLLETLIAGRERKYVRWFLTTKTASPDTFSVDDVDRYSRLFAAAGGVGAVLAYYRSVVESARQNRELVRRGRIRVPVLAVSADRGSVPDMAAAVRSVADDVSGVTITGSGHFIPEEQPGQLLEALRAFLARDLTTRPSG